MKILHNASRTTKFENGDKIALMVGGIIAFILRMRDLEVQIWLTRVQSLAMNILLRTKYIEEYTRGMFPMEHKILPKNSAAAAIMGADTKAKVTSTLSHGAPTDEQNKHVTIWIEKSITIPAETDSLIVAVLSKMCSYDIRTDVNV